jgi:MFS transporter, Spinster family, sphingosine-1-phosphate transporter
VADKSTTFEYKLGLWWAGQESNLHSFRGGFTDRWARHVPFADPRRRRDRHPRSRPPILPNTLDGELGAARPRSLARGYARYVLAVMVAINFLNYCDRWVAAAAAPLIQVEFRLSDFQVGLLATAFLLVYAVAAVPFGYWADRGVRKTVIGVGVAIWSVATVLSGFVLNYFQLFLTRAVLGLGEASYYPAGTSLVSDYFPAERRGRAMSIWSAGAALGIAVGFAGGGYVAEHFGWRRAFLFAAIPGIICAALAFTLREPLRGAAERVGPQLERTYEASLSAFLNLLRIPTLRATIFSQTFLYFVLASQAFWLPTQLHRRYAMTVSQASLLSGVVIVLGGLIGTLVGGFVADRLSRRSQRGHLLVGMAGFLIASVTITLALLAPMSVGGVPLFVPLFFVSVVCVYLHAGPFTAVAQNVVTPGLRAGAVTMLLLVSHLFGDSHAPADVGWLSDQLHSLQLALLLTSAPLLLLAAASAATALGSADRDSEIMERTWAKTQPEPGAKAAPAN